MGQVHPVIIICIMICVMMLLWVLWKEQILEMFRDSIIGICMIIIINSLLPQTLQVGVNYLSIGCSALLGLPGIMMLYVINCLIK